MESALSTVSEPVASESTAATPSPVTDAGLTASPADSTGGVPSVTPSSTPAPVAFDPAKLPPEHQTAFKSWQAEQEKKYSNYSEYEKRAKAFDTLVGHPEFREWYQNRQTPKPAPAPEKPQALDISDEDFSAILGGDKAKFAQVLDKMVQQRAEGLIGPKLQKTEQEVTTMRRVSEIERFAKDNADFWKLDDDGKIEPLIQKYPQLPIADVYKLAKFDTLKQEAVARAHGIVEKKRAAVTEKPGVSSANSQGKVKVKDRIEAMEIAAEYGRKGLEAPVFEYAHR